MMMMMITVVNKQTSALASLTNTFRFRSTDLRNVLLVTIELKLINLLGRTARGRCPERRDVSGMLGQGSDGCLPSRTLSSVS